MRKRSMQQQLIHALSDCSAIGESKRSRQKQVGEDDYKVYSVAYMNDLRTTAKDLGEFIKRMDPDIRFVRNVTVDVLQAYLQKKADSGLSREYLCKLHSHLCKLELCIDKTYGCTDWRVEQLRVPAIFSKKTRDHVACEADVQELIKVMRQPHCGDAWKAVVLAYSAGLRVNEAANVRVGRLNKRGGRWGCGTITLRGSEDGCKGGRWRTIDILSTEHRDALSEVIKGLNSDDYVITGRNGSPVKSDSLNRALKRAVERSGIPWKEGNGFHAMRKSFAQSSYDAARMSGCSKRESEDYANKQLGHGANRSDLTKVYISRLW